MKLIGGSPYGFLLKNGVLRLHIIREHAKRMCAYSHEQPFGTFSACTQTTSGTIGSRWLPDLSVLSVQMHTPVDGYISKLYLSRSYI